MATIKKFTLPPSDFQFLKHKVCTINHILNITDNVFQYKLTQSPVDDETEDTIIYDFTLSLDALKTHSRFSDQSYWTFNCSELPEATEDLSNVQLLSIFDLSFPTKRSRLILSTDIEYNKSIRMFVPSANSTFSDCLFLVAQPLDIIPAGTVIPEEMDLPNITTTTTVNTPNVFINEVAPSITKSIVASVTSSTTLSSPTAGTIIPVTVTCSDANVTRVYLEGIVGLTDRTEVPLTAGVGSFNIITDSLASGDTVKVKIGHKKYSSVNTFTKQLA